nr:AAA family ATPase [Coriobacterium glomerans]
MLLRASAGAVRRSSCFRPCASSSKRGPRELIVSFLFDDERIMPYRDSTAQDLLDAYYNLVPQATEGCYLLFDEIQDLPRWSSFIRRIAEQHRVSIVLRGSSSRLPSSDIPSVFRGRSLAREMWPLSFKEYCSFHDIEPPRFSETYTRREHEIFEKAFDGYLVCGGGGVPAGQALPPLERMQLRAATERIERQRSQATVR